MSLAILIFARMSSSRLPGKMCEKIGSKSLIFHIIDRAKKIKMKKKIIIATSSRKSDDKLVKEAKKRKVLIFRGNLNNVVKRAYDCCKRFNLDAFVRICGDRILFDYKDIDEAISNFTSAKTKFDLASNLLNGKIPAGQTIEILSLEALKKITKQRVNKYDLEHLTTFIYKNKKKFKILKLKKPRFFKDHRYSFAIDTPKDLERFNFIHKKIKNFSYENNQEILKFTKKWYLNRKKNN